MTISRRSLLVGILASSVAPSIVKASSLMKIAVPPSMRGEPLDLGKNVLWTPDFNLGFPEFTLEWFAVVDTPRIDDIRLLNCEGPLAPLQRPSSRAEYAHLAVTSNGFYANGKLVPEGPYASRYASTMKVLLREIKSHGLLR